MESLKLSEQEQHLYWDLFNTYDVERCGILIGPHVSDLFLTSGLPPEIIHQIIEICGAKRLGHFGQVQFFIALKLIAAAQNGLPVVLDVCNSGIELPLPRFAVQFNSDLWMGQATHPAFIQPPNMRDPRLILYDRNLSMLHFPQQQQQPGTKGARSYPAPPRSLSLAVTSQPQTMFTQDKGSPTSPSISNRKQSAPVLSHTMPTSNAIDERYGPYVLAGTGARAEGAILEHKTEKGWASFEDDYQASITNPEHKEWTQFADSSKTETSSMSSEGGPEDVWIIMDEQREYYINQFKTMQDDVRGVISGGVAKEFFEKSRLPVAELSKIWQLSDFNRDGALSLEEFCTAMHLVVLRRNYIELPDSLPSALLPYEPIISSDETFAADLPPDIAVKKLSPTPSISSQQWTTAFPLPSESPTSSSVSSPGNKATPVNFEFKPITADPDSKIVHPVALRMSPDGQPYTINNDTSVYSDTITFMGNQDHLDDDDDDDVDDDDDDDVSPQMPPVITDLLIDIGLDSSSHQQHLVQPIPRLIHGRPRPTPKKAQSLPGPAPDAGVQRILPLPLPPPPSQESFVGDRTAVLVPMQMTLDGAPPAPPPRVVTGHSRSSSLDNQLIDLSDGSGHEIKFPPLVPPRPSPKDKTVDSPCGSSSERQNSREDLDTSYITSGRYLKKHGSLERRDLLSSIRNQKERNLVLSRLNNELNQELQEVMEQRIALEIQMEHLQG